MEHTTLAVAEYGYPSTTSLSVPVPLQLQQQNRDHQYKKMTRAQRVDLLKQGRSKLRIKYTFIAASKAPGGHEKSYDIKLKNKN